MKKNVKFVLLLAMVFVVSFCAVPTFATEDDERIKSAIETTYVFKTFLANDSITVEVDKGIVTLAGEVLGDSHRTLAKETAQNVLGVITVKNELVTEAETAAKKSDYWIGKKVTLSLMFHRNVDATNTTVEVDDGVVTLKGVAMNEAQKELTAEYAKDISGVVSVTNDMTVAVAPVAPARTLSERIDDASIVGLVKAELSARKSTNALDTKVVVREGVVTLTGIAKNETEKSLVNKIVEDIYGVVSVTNDMTIEIP